MIKIIVLFLVLIFTSCNPKSGLHQVTILPKDLHEVSGVEKLKDSELLWMHNDSGNKSYVYGIDSSGKIKEKVLIKEKNTDWEDVSSDEEGNLYIGDFGNNENKRKNLVILKVKKKDLLKNKKAKAKKIKFTYPDQDKFPPNKENLFFDAESFFYANGYLYVFTKSAVKNEYGKTKLYKIPAEEGKHKAQLIATFNAGDTENYRITSASISPNKKKVVLLTRDHLFLFTNFTSDQFFNGDFTKIDLQHSSQKEGVTFKNNNTVYITDEKKGKTGGNLYEYSFSNN